MWCGLRNFFFLGVGFTLLFLTFLETGRVQAYDPVCDCQGPWAHKRTESKLVQCESQCGGPSNRSFFANLCTKSAWCQECWGSGQDPYWCTVNECGVLSLNTAPCPQMSLD